MSTYLESVRTQNENDIADKTKEHDKRNAQAISDWSVRLSPLEDRLSKLLETIPSEIKNKGLSLPAIRSMLAGKWRGKCHSGELGTALRRLGYERRRKWAVGSESFSALWFVKEPLK